MKPNWQFIKTTAKRTLALLTIAGVIIGAWYGFLWLVAPPPLDTTPALIMVWLSAAVTLLALFPNALDRIKKLKVKDFELELQETVEKAAKKTYPSVVGFEDQLFSVKGNLSRLEPIVERAMQYPSKSTLLVVDLRENRSISIQMLFIYLFYLDLIGASVIVLFVSSRSTLRNISDIAKDDLIGAISGKKVLREFYERFQSLTEIFAAQSRNGNFKISDIFTYRRFDGKLTRLLQDVYSDLISGEPRFREHLSQSDVKEWFKVELSSRIIDASISASDIKILREAIAQGDEYILIYGDSGLDAVVSTCFLTEDLAKKVLADLAETQS